MIRPPLAAVLLALLAACTVPGTPPATEAAADAAAPAIDQPVQDVPPATAPARRAHDAPPSSTSAAPAPAASQVASHSTSTATRPHTVQPRLDGFGPLRLGMTTRDAVAAWPGLYADRPQRVAARSCDYAQVPNGALPYFALTFDGGRFVRFGGTSDDLTAPGGGRRGMSVAALQRLYRGGLSQLPDPERPRGDGYRLVADTPGAVPVRLAFVIERGRVLEWYVGMLQGETDHTLGCPH